VRVEDRPLSRPVIPHADGKYNLWLRRVGHLPPRKSYVHVGQLRRANGHLKVGPNGTAYVPNKRCSDNPGGIFVTPNEAGISKDLIWRLGQRTPSLVCACAINASQKLSAAGCPCPATCARQGFVDQPSEVGRCSPKCRRRLKRAISFLDRRGLPHPLIRLIRVLADGGRPCCALRSCLSISDLNGKFKLILKNSSLY